MQNSLVDEREQNKLKALENARVRRRNRTSSHKLWWCSLSSPLSCRMQALIPQPSLAAKQVSNNTQSHVTGITYPAIQHLMEFDRWNKDIMTHDYDNRLTLFAFLLLLSSSAPESSSASPWSSLASSSSSSLGTAFFFFVDVFLWALPWSSLLISSSSSTCSVFCFFDNFLDSLLLVFTRTFLGSTAADFLFLGVETATGSSSSSSSSLRIYNIERW